MAVVRTRRTQIKHPGAIYVIPGGHPGLLVAGNINLWDAPIIRNPNGSYSTVHSVSWNVPVNIDHKVRNLEVLMPTALGTREHPARALVSDREALRAFQRTGRHLGMFDTGAHASTYANRLHLWFVANAKWFVLPRKK